MSSDSELTFYYEAEADADSQNGDTQLEEIQTLLTQYYEDAKFEGEKQKILVGQTIQTAIKSLPSWVLSMKAADFVDRCSEPAFEQNFNIRL